MADAGAAHCTGHTRSNHGDVIYSDHVWPDFILFGDKIITTF